MIPRWPRLPNWGTSDKPTAHHLAHGHQSADRQRNSISIPQDWVETTTDRQGERISDFNSSGFEKKSRLSKAWDKFLAVFNF